ncbi:hypothetical protein L915_19811 [Phytophthora nicotianae]|uniref:Uncharacterized protein n=2 Tax=Phytophthora nicotianae TaxID=4792 RepID=V9E1S5_PHYNI|nr:hypothetical protein F443_20376 [Phytophthora nicotianae P1569]ETK73236.1 hypothetical protein L915_19811 [Phytophthora nicotianae]
MEALDARAGEVLGNTTARATKYVSIRALARFVDWLYGHTDDSHRVVLFTRSFLSLNRLTTTQLLSGLTECLLQVQSTLVYELLRTACDTLLRWSSEVSRGNQLLAIFALRWCICTL